MNDGYEDRLATGVVFVDLTAAYDTVIHRTLLSKLYNITNDYNLTIRILLEKRRFFITKVDGECRKIDCRKAACLLPNC